MSRLTEIPYDMLYSIVESLNHPEAISNLRSTSRELRRTIKPPELHTSMDFSINSTEFKTQYYTKLGELSVNLQQKGKDDELNNLRKKVKKFLIDNFYKLSHDTVMHKLNLSRGQYNVSISISFEEQIRIYDELIGLYLQICNFPNTHNDIYYLSELYKEKAIICYNIIELGSERSSAKINALFNRTRYIRFELLKMLLYIQLTSINKIDSNLLSLDNTLEAITDHDMGLLEGISGFTQADMNTYLCCQYLRYSIASYVHTKIYHYLRVKRTVEKMFSSTTSNTIISFPNTTYTTRSEKSKDFKNMKTDSVKKCREYIQNKSKTKLIPNHKPVLFI